MLIIEMWESIPPTIVTDKEGIPLEFSSLEAALEEASNCQDGYVLDFENMKIIKPVE